MFYVGLDIHSTRISTCVLSEAELLAIPRRNIATLRALGREKVPKMLKAIEGSPTRSA